VTTRFQQLLVNGGFAVGSAYYTDHPILKSGQAWSYPNFLGLDGFLSRIRFAVDPTENVFYFGYA